MNVIFVSPQFPKTYWNFCDRLKERGVNVLAIGDTPYDALDVSVKRSVNEYYYCRNMTDYDQMYRAVAFFAFKYGRIDWIESNNEFWLESDARIRTDFNIRSGVGLSEISGYKSKFQMKDFYKRAGVPCARCLLMKDEASTRAFVDEVGLPVIIKPDNGVGANDTYKIETPEDLDAFFAAGHTQQFVCEEFIYGDIYSYDAINDSNADPLFESMTKWPPSIADIVNKGLDLNYYVCKDVNEQLRELGRKTVKVFNARSRFVHLEFFRLTKARKGLGEVGDFVALEVNMRPAGGYTPDMINFAHSSDVYRIWADMIVYDENRQPKPHMEYFCAYAGRKDVNSYVHTHEEIIARYGANMVMCERMPEINVATMGNQMYTVKLDTEEQVQEFIHFVQDRT